MSLDLALEELEAASGSVEKLQEFVRKNGEGNEEEVADEKKWTVARAEALAKTKRVENGFAKNEEKSVTTLTGAVKDYNSNAHVSKLNKPQGQQKWKGEFETEYQRRKKISTEESLKEIEDWALRGKLPDGKYMEKKETGAQNVREKLEENIREQGEGGNGLYLSPGRKYQSTIARSRGPSAGRKYQSTIARTNSSSSRQHQAPSPRTTGHPPHRQFQSTISRGTGAPPSRKYQSTMRPSSRTQGRKPAGRGISRAPSQEESAARNLAVRNFTERLSKAGNQGEKFFEQFEQKTLARFKPSKRT